MQAASKSNTKVAAPGRIPLKAITVSELNPRYGADLEVGGLAKNLKRVGLLQPITIRGTATGGYEVVIGSRRFRAMVAERGEEGFLEPDEYVYVDWTDEFTIRASVAENDQREDLSVVDMGRFLNRAADRDSKMTEERLATLTGFGGRQRVSELRDLARRLHLLPESWQKDLQLPDRCRPGDKPRITLTHFKHIRSSIVDDKILPDVLKTMEEAAADENNRWSANLLKQKLDELKAGDGVKPPAGASSAEGGKTSGETAAPAKDEKPTQPVYERVVKHLTSAMEASGTDKDLVELIQRLIKHVEDKAASLVAKPEVHNQDAKAAA